MKRVVVSTLLIFFCLSAFAQKFIFSGKVLTEGSKLPIEFATVVMTDKEL